MTLLLVDFSGELLDFEVVEALVHQQVDTDHLVELADSETANGFENAEEDHAEDACPGNNDDAAEGLDFKHGETSCVDQAEVFVEDSHGEAAPKAGESKYLETPDRVVDFVPIQQLSCSHRV